MLLQLKISDTSSCDGKAHSQSFINICEQWERGLVSTGPYSPSSQAKM